MPNGFGLPGLLISPPRGGESARKVRQLRTETTVLILSLFPSGETSVIPRNSSSRGSASASDGRHAEWGKGHEGQTRQVMRDVHGTVDAVDRAVRRWRFVGPGGESPCRRSRSRSGEGGHAAQRRQEALRDRIRSQAVEGRLRVARRRQRLAFINIDAPPPTGTFTFINPKGADGKPKTYTIPEIIEIINDGLAPRYTLLRRNTGFRVVPADVPIDKELLQQVTREELARPWPQRGRDPAAPAQDAQRRGPRSRGEEVPGGVRRGDAAAVHEPDDPAGEGRTVCGAGSTSSKRTTRRAAFETYQHACST